MALDTSSEGNCVKNLLLLDSTVHGYEKIQAAVNASTTVVCFDSGYDTYDSLKEKISAAGSAKYNNVGIVQHGTDKSPVYRLLCKSKASRVHDVESKDAELASWVDFRGLLMFLKDNCEAKIVDLISCKLYSNPGWVYALNKLEQQTGLNLRASSDDTGNLANGGNWVQESDNVNIQNIYFTDLISQFTGLLYNTYSTRYPSDKVSSTHKVSGMISNSGTEYKRVNNMFGKTSSEYITGTDFTVSKDVTLYVPFGNTYTFPPNIVAVQSIYYYSNAAYIAIDGSGAVYINGYGVNSNDPWNRYTITFIASGAKAIATTNSAVAILMNNGTVQLFGNENEGGTNNTGVALTNVVAIASTSAAFAALKSDSTVVVWGDAMYGGSMGNQIVYDGWGGAAYGATANGNSLTNIVAIASNRYAFAALKSDGSVCVWGDESYGGFNNQGGTLTNIVSIASSDTAFIAIKTDGSVVSWGQYNVAPSYSTTFSGLSTDKATHIATMGNGFAILRENGAVFVQSNNYEGYIHNPTTGQAKVIAIASTYGEIACLLDDNQTIKGIYNTFTIPNCTAIVSGSNNSGSNCFVAITSTGFVQPFGDTFQNNYWWPLSIDGGATNTNQTAGVDAVAVGINYLYTLTADHKVKFWDIYNGNETVVVDSSASKIFNISSNGNNAVAIYTSVLPDVVPPTNIVAAISAQAKSNALADAAQVSVTYSGGDSSMTIQWRVSTDSGTSWTDIAGATSATNQAIQYLAAYNGSTVQVKAVLTFSSTTYDSNTITLIQPPYNLTLIEVYSAPGIDTWATLKYEASGNKLGVTRDLEINVDGGTGSTNGWIRAYNYYSNTYDSYNVNSDGSVSVRYQPQFVGHVAKFRMKYTYLGAVQYTNELELVRKPPSLPPTNVTIIQIAPFTAVGQTQQFTVDFSQVYLNSSNIPGVSYVWQLSNSALNNGEWNSYVLDSVNYTKTLSLTYQAGYVGNTVKLRVKLQHYDYVYIYSPEIEIVLRNPPVITTPPQSVTQTYGTDFSLSVVATGDPTLTYQWYKSSGGVLSIPTPIANANTATLTITNAAVGDAAFYSVEVSNNYGFVRSTPVQVVLTDAIVDQPDDVVVAYGGTATFTGQVLDGYISYKWFKDNGDNVATIADAPSIQNGNVLTITDVSQASIGKYYFIAEKEGGANPKTSRMASLNIPVYIYEHPTSRTVQSGFNNHTFAVFVYGSSTGLQYQWQKKSYAAGSSWSDITGETASQLNFATVRAIHAASYRVKVKNAYNTDWVVSNSADLHVAAAITQQPSNVTVQSGSSHTFSVSVDGEATGMMYQWFKDGVEIADASQSTYTINPILAANAGTYMVKIKNDYNADWVSSSNATLHVAAVITAQPTGADLNSGSSHTFSVSVDGESTGMMYQWFKNGVEIADASQSTYTINPVNANSAGIYMVKIKNDYNADWVSSSNAIIHVAGEVTAQPAGGNVGVVSGSSTTPLSITTFGEISSIQWQRKEVGAADSEYADIASATNASYNAAPLYTYRAKVNGYQLVDYYTTATTVYVLQSPTGAQADQTKYVMNGDSITLSAPTMTGSDLGYIWTYNGTMVPGTNTNTFTITPSMFGKSYSVSITNPYDSISTTQVFNIVEALKITSDLQSDSIAFGTTKTLSVTAAKGDPTATITYQWYKGGVAISGANSSSYTTAQAGAYKVAVGIQGTSSSVDSVTATLTSILGLTTQPPATLNIQSGTSATIPGPVAGGDSGITYTWYKQGVTDAVRAASDVSGLSLGPVDNTTAGSYYCVVKSDANTAGITSSVTAVHITAAITAQPAPATVEKSVSKADAAVDHTFTVGASGEKIAFQWYRKPVGADDSAYAPVYGARAAIYNIPALAVSDAGVYRVKIMDEFASSFYSTTQTLRIQPTIMTQPSAATVAFNSNATFTVDASGEQTLTYQWYGPAGLISGATAASYTVTANAVSKAGNYYVKVKNSVGTGVAGVDSAQVRLNISPTLLTLPSLQVVAYGQNATFTSDASGEGLSYAWTKTGNSTVLSTGKTLTLTNVKVADAGSYTVTVTGTYSPAVSAAASLVVGPTILSGGAPVGVSKFVGESASFTVSASGEQLTYKWFKDVSGNTTVVSGALGGSTSDDVQQGSTTSTLTFASVATTTAGWYYVEVLGKTGTVMAVSAPFRLNVKANLYEPLAPINVTENSQAAIWFKVQGEYASGSNPRYNANVYKDGVLIYTNGQTGTKYGMGENGSTSSYAVIYFSFSNTGVSDAGMYKIEVWNAHNAASPFMSNEVRLSVTPRITTDLIPLTAAYVGQQNFSFTVAAAGETPMSFVWKKNTNNIIASDAANWEIVSSSSNGTGTSTMTLKRPFAVTDMNYYMVDVSNNYGTKSSNNVYLRPKATLKTHLAYGSSILGSAYGSSSTPYIIQYGVAPTAKLTLESYFDSGYQANVVYYTEDASNVLTPLITGDSSSFSFTSIGPNLYKFTLNLTAEHTIALANASVNGTKKVHLRVYVNDTYSNPYAGDKTQFSDVFIDFAAAFTGISRSMRPQIDGGDSIIYDIKTGSTSPLLAYTFYKGSTPIVIDGTKYSVAVNNSSQIGLNINHVTMSDIANYYATISNGKVPTGAADANVAGTPLDLHIVPSGGTVTYTQTPLFIGDNFTLTYTNVSGEMPMEYRYYNQANTQVSNPISYTPNSTEYLGLRKTTSDSVVSLVQPINDAYQEYGHAVFNEWKPYTNGLTVPTVQAKVATLAYWPDSTGTKRYGNNVKTNAAPDVVYFDVNSGTSTTTIPGLSGSAGKAIIKLWSNPQVNNIRWQRMVGSTDGVTGGTWVELSGNSTGFIGQFASFPFNTQVSNSQTADSTTLTNYALPAFTVDANTAGAYRMVMTQTRGHTGMYNGSMFLGPTLCFRIIPIIQNPLPPMLNLVKVGDVASFTIRATNMSNIIWKRVKNGSSETIVSVLGTNVGVGNRYTNSVSGLVGTLSFVVQDGDEGYTYYAHPANPAAPTGVPNTAGTEFHIPASFNVAPSTIIANLAYPSTFNVSSYGKLPVRYRWYKNGQIYQDLELNSKTNSLPFPKVINEDGANYMLHVTNAYTVDYEANFGGVAQKANFELKIKPVILADTIQDDAVMFGSALTYRVNAGGRLPLTYQWYKDGSAMTGKTSNELKIDSAVTGDSGAYRCKVENVDGWVLSKAANVTVTTELSSMAFDEGNMPLNQTMDITVNGVAYKAMKQNFANNGAIFNMENKDIVNATLSSANAGVASMGFMYAQPVFDGINYKMKLVMNVFDSDNVKVRQLANGASMSIVWDLPYEFTVLNKPTLVLEHLEDDGVTVKELITATRRSDGKYESVHSSFSPFQYTTTDVPCFPAGTRVLTAAGYRAVEDLSAEDKIVTADGRAVAFNRYATHIAKTTAATAPYEIAAGAFGRSSPAAAVRLSPLHAIQSRKGVWQIPKYAALSNAGVKQYGVGESVTYYHIELPNYFTDNIVAEGGAVVESFANKQAKGLKNVFKYNATLGGFTRIGAKAVAKK